MIDQIYVQVKDALFANGNQFLQGGLVLGLLGSAGYYLKSLPRRIWNLFMFHCTTVVEVTSFDKAYNWLLTWLEAQPYNTKARRIAIRDVKNKDGDMEQLLVPARGNHWFFHKGLPIWINRAKESDGGDAAQAAQSVSSANMPQREIISIRTIGRNRRRINEIVAQAKARYSVNTSGKTRVHFHRWGSYELVLKLKRPIESVFLPPSAAELLNDIKRFIESEAWYRKMGIPYRRGYLFHGPAGTGKSTSVEAIAGYFDIPIYVLNISNFSSGSQFEQAIKDMDHFGPAILLLEDIDTSLKKRDDIIDDDDEDMGEDLPKTKAVADTISKKETIPLGTILNGLD